MPASRAAENLGLIHGIHDDSRILQCVAKSMPVAGIRITLPAGFAGLFEVFQERGQAEVLFWSFLLRLEYRHILDRRGSGASRQRSEDATGENGPAWYESLPH